MLREIKNYYLKRKVKQEVELFYIQMGINPKDLENMTMAEILEKVEYTMKNLAGYRDEYYRNLDCIAVLNGEIAHLNAEYKEVCKKMDELFGENNKLKMKNQFLTQQCKTYQLANNKRIVENRRSNVVSYGSEREHG